MIFYYRWVAFCGDIKNAGPTNYTGSIYTFFDSLSRKQTPDTREAGVMIS